MDEACVAVNSGKILIVTLPRSFVSLSIRSLIAIIIATTVLVYPVFFVNIPGYAGSTKKNF